MILNLDKNLVARYNLLRQIYLIIQLATKKQRCGFREKTSLLDTSNQIVPFNAMVRVFTEGWWEYLNIYLYENANKYWAKKRASEQENNSRCFSRKRQKTTVKLKNLYISGETHTFAAKGEAIKNKCQRIKRKNVDSM